MPVELDHIILSVSDVATSARFYYKALGLKYEPEALIRVTPSFVIQMIQRPPQVSEHLAFSVGKADFEAAVDRLRAAEIPYGDNFDRVGNMQGPGRASGSRKDGASIYFHDPDKHMIEIICYERS